MLHRAVRIAAVTATVALLVAIPFEARAEEDHPWGTWLHKVEGMPVPALVTVHFDGTLNVTAGFMFGGGFLPIRLSPIHGVWKRTGFRSITATSIFMVFDPTGMMTGYQRNRCNLKFDRDFNSYEGNEYMETLGCTGGVCPDPLDPVTVWTPLQGMPEGGFPVTAGRLQVVPLPQ